jgi:L-seryl-tRNA(Ser) seleniumtransferase
MSGTILPGAGESSLSNAARPHLPSVDRMLGDAQLSALIGELGREPVKRAIQQELEAQRQAMRDGSKPLGHEATIERIQARTRQACASRLRAVINLTGTVIHTNLGRALLADEAIDSVMHAMRGYAALEFDIDSGERGDRDTVVEELLCRITGAEAATVVNNCAAAVLLSLVALGARKEVVISRGEQIEIGGAFRMPDIMRAANCKLVEVGTTNRTHLADYSDAITDKSALIVKAHRSNYAVTGFTAEVSDAELARLANQHGIAYMVDLGSGALIDMSAWGLPREPLPSDALAAGAHVVMFSGDKLLGGPQAGIIVGTRQAIAKIKKHPLKRALRVSKMVLAALEATLRIYDSHHQVIERLPVLAMLTRDRDTIRQICERVAPALHAFVGSRFDVEIRDCASQIGSGALPEERLPSSAVVLIPKDRGKGVGRMLAQTLAALRGLPVPVIGRIRDDSIVLDCRCLNPVDEQVLLDQLRTTRPQ